MNPAGAGSAGLVRVRATVEGRVQGVWYRESCRRRADELGVAGDVRNTAAGTVEIDVQGSRAAVEALLGWARQGPPAARVTAVRVEDLPLHEVSGFRVV